MTATPAMPAGGHEPATDSTEPLAGSSVRPPGRPPRRRLRRPRRRPAPLRGSRPHRARGPPPDGPRAGPAGSRPPRPAPRPHPPRTPRPCSIHPPAGPACVRPLRSRPAAPPATRRPAPGLAPAPARRRAGRVRAGGRARGRLACSRRSRGHRRYRPGRPGRGGAGRAAVARLLAAHLARLADVVSDPPAQPPVLQRPGPAKGDGRRAPAGGGVRRADRGQRDGGDPRAPGRHDRRAGAAAGQPHPVRVERARPAHADSSCCPPSRTCPRPPPS